MNVHIREDWNNGVVELFLFEEGENSVRYVAKPIELIFEKTERGQTLAPTLRLEQRSWAQFGQAFLEALEKAGFQAVSTKLQKEKGLKDEATLEATKYHLEDMRKIAFEPIKYSYEGPEKQ